MVEVTHHGITVPTGEELDHISITVPLEEGHSPPGAKGTGREVLRRDARRRFQGACMTTHRLGDHGGSDGDADVMGVIVCSKFECSIIRGGGMQRLVAVEHELAEGGRNRTAERVSTLRMCNDIPTDTILLCGKGELHRGGCFQFMIGREGVV